MRDRKSFVHILETLDAFRRDDASDRGFANPLSTATAPIPTDADDDPGVENLWDHAFAWALDRAPDATEPPRTDLEVPSSDDPEEIDAELGLASFSTGRTPARATAVHVAQPPGSQARNPGRSRQPPLAIANMLIDRALKRLSRVAPPS